MPHPSLEPVRRYVPQRSARLLALWLFAVLPSLGWTQTDPLGSALAAYQEKRYEQAYSLFQPLAQQENAEAQFFLGVLYCEGLGVAQDCLTGARWYWRAALQGHGHAQYNLGVLHSTGQGVPKDPSAAVHWWKKAAAQGLVKAQFNLGLAYLDAQGVSHDVEQAEFWWRKAAEQGYAPAQYNLASLYQQGLKGAPDNTQARHWFEQAAAQGDANARQALAALPVETKPAPQINTKPKPDPQQKPAAKPPADKPPTAAISPGMGWLRKQPAAHFTVQVASESSLERAQSFARTHSLKTAIVVKLNSGKQPVYAILLGSYPTRAAATGVLQKLSPELRQQRKPWVRSFDALQAAAKS